MTAFDSLSQIWGKLREEGATQAGIYERRIFSKSARSLFAGLRNPGGMLRIHLYVYERDLGEWRDLETRGFVLVADRKVVVDGRIRIRLELVHSDFGDLFGRLCSDAVGAIIDADSDAKAVLAMRDRVEHWRRFIESAGPSGLSDDEQVGLYGELIFFNELIVAGLRADSVLDAWLGPMGANHDYCFGSTAVEVKSTISNVDSIIHVANENQLDVTGFDFLGLCRVSLYRRSNLSSTLPALVRSISSSIDPASVPRFMDRLLSAGFHIDDEARYVGFGYVLRGICYYSVSSGFPRIVPSDLAPGVSKVSYTVDLAAAETFKVAYRDLLRAVS